MFYQIITVKILILLALTPPCHAVRFNKSEPTVWLDTPYEVETGLTLNVVNYHITNPCDIFDDQLNIDLEHSNHNRWTKTSIDRFSRLCYDDVDNIFRPRFEAFQKCGKKKDTGLIRNKRGIWFVIGSVFIVQCMTTLCATAVVVDKLINNVNADLVESRERAKQAISALKGRDE